VPAKRLPNRDDLEQAAKDHVETTHYADPVTGEPYEPDEPPEVSDPEGDEDAEG
jgi:hypothetical protein